MFSLGLIARLWRVETPTMLRLLLCCDFVLIIFFRCGRVISALGMLRPFPRLAHCASLLVAVLCARSRGHFLGKASGVDLAGAALSALRHEPGPLSLGPGVQVWRAPPRRRSDQWALGCRWRAALMWAPASGNGRRVAAPTPSSSDAPGWTDTREEQYYKTIKCPYRSPPDAFAEPFVTTAVVAGSK